MNTIHRLSFFCTVFSAQSFLFLCLVLLKFSTWLGLWLSIRLRHSPLVRSATFPVERENESKELTCTVVEAGLVQVP